MNINKNKHIYSVNECVVQRVRMWSVQQKEAVGFNTLRPPGENEWPSTRGKATHSTVWRREPSFSVSIYTFILALWIGVEPKARLNHVVTNFSFFFFSPCCNISFSPSGLRATSGNEINYWNCVTSVEKWHGHETSNASGKKKGEKNPITGPMVINHIMYWNNSSEARST